MTRPAKYSTPLCIGETAWQAQVSSKLLDGFGVEDIALWLDCHVSHVQAEVKRLRADGRLKAWWGK